ncbi:hypothetical protein E2C01_039993 [Portunus trituberculatus]|uniref:Uncharacterized protein n=1 Tax=Portunus trituberculatus TaxID=210409 RepID=A0A5B7FMS1_PORTR|nr:hypothetical protein [Portunus trituberculatus]
MAWGVWCIYVLGAGVRLWLMNSSGADFIAKRVEFSTPLNSWKRGHMLTTYGGRPHAKVASQRDVGHVVDLRLHLESLGGLIPKSWRAYLPLLFVACDLLTAALLAAVAASYSRKQVSSLLV